MVAHETPLRCKLEGNDKIFEELMTFKYLGVEMAGDGRFRNKLILNPLGYLNEIYGRKIL